MQSKTQHNLNRETVKIFTLQSGNTSNYGWSVLPEKYFLDKAATIKRFEYSVLAKAFKKQANIF